MADKSPAPWYRKKWSRAPKFIVWQTRSGDPNSLDIRILIGRFLGVIFGLLSGSIPGMFAFAAVGDLIARHSPAVPRIRRRYHRTRGRSRLAGFTVDLPTRLPFTALPVWVLFVTFAYLISSLDIAIFKYATELETWRRWTILSDNIGDILMRLIDSYFARHLPTPNVEPSTYTAQVIARRSLGWTFLLGLIFAPPLIKQHIASARQGLNLYGKLHAPLLIEGYWGIMGLIAGIFGALVSSSIASSLCLWNAFYGGGDAGVLKIRGLSLTIRPAECQDILCGVMRWWNATAASAVIIPYMIQCTLTLLIVILLLLRRRP